MSSGEHLAPNGVFGAESAGGAGGADGAMPDLELDPEFIRMRVRNYRRSLRVAPSAWRTMFETLIVETEKML